ncbi:5-formyltetrahydrofolate cyclo-ligase [Vagococcus vulneris]|uniref:5-formyltetrahydrofolate cyclo-ligase n=1 Tax=Vagococcus vulneris TaxID=1977869 RepID=A0A429ZZP2_9ENTE|nr:5-formyltetrahydrofolate cyclo-ligase [Vagococcus vulneris]RST99496.1 5-formyltetrahydrofolate cyclo-ligase [Vagococcus vulneris]
MVKKVLRTKKIKSLKELADNQELKTTLEYQVLNKLFMDDIWKKSNVIGTVIPFPHEFDYWKLIHQAFSENKRIALPKTYQKGVMHFYEYEQNDTLTPSSFGAMEPNEKRILNPEEISLLIVPGVVFNESGFRIGYGGGFYDRYLESFPNETCSLIFSTQLDNSWQPENHDQQVNKLFVGEKG